MIWNFYILISFWWFLLVYLFSFCYNPRTEKAKDECEEKNFTVSKRSEDTALHLVIIVNKCQAEKLLSNIYLTKPGTNSVTTLGVNSYCLYNNTVES